MQNKMWFNPTVTNIKASHYNSGVRARVGKMLWERRIILYLQHKTKTDLKNVMFFTSCLTLGSLTESAIFFTWLKIIFMSIIKSLENESI